MCDIKNGPGKFEGEPCYASAVYDAILEGMADVIDFPADCDCPDTDVCECTGDSVDVFAVDAEFRAAHGIAEDIVVIAAEETDSGFFCTSELTAQALAKLEAEATAEAADDLDVCADCEQPNDSNVVDGCHECKRKG